MMRDTKNSSLVYHLAEALTSFIYASGAKLYQRKNILGYIQGSVAAMLDWKDADREALAEIEADIVFLNETYEPVLDNSEYSFEKRIAYEEYLRITTNKLLKLIYQNNLVSNQIMKEVYAARWSKDGGGRNE
jgi:hypothetical protein